MPRPAGTEAEPGGSPFPGGVGESLILMPGQKTELVKSLGTREELQKLVKKNDRNEVHLIVRGNRLQHFTSGTLMSEVPDEDPEKRKATGLVGVRVHVGPPMKIEFRKILLKRL